MSIKITGVDEVLANLQRLQNNAEALHGNHEVPFTELYPDSFMAGYTNFPTMQAMLDASGIAESEELHGERWNSFVATQSQFSNWDEMQKKAGGEWAARKLGF